MRQYWCTGHNAPTVAHSSTVTCPARVAPLARIQLSPIVESWPMCAYAMMRQFRPTRVVPPPPAVPREIVTHSRITVSVPISTLVGSPAYFRSCGATPTAAKLYTRHPSPSLVWPSITTCDTSSQCSPSTTLAPTVQYGPTFADLGTVAPAAIRAVG